MTGVRGLDHINLRAPVEIIERVRQFYIDVIGLREGPRPSFRSGSHGYWLYAGDTPVLHLSISPALDPNRSDSSRPDSSRLDPSGIASARPNSYFNHYALACSDFAGARARLDAAGVSYSIDRIEERNQVQVFATDPAGIIVELDFQLDEP